MNVFVPEDMAKRLGLKVEKMGVMLNIVNSKEVLVMGLAWGVPKILGQWVGKEKIEVVFCHNYNVIIEQKFLDRIQALLVSFINYLCILDPKCLYVLPVKRKKGSI